MIDVHSHILAEIDDGARDWNASIEMARLYAEHGYEAVIATPHVLADEAHRPTSDEIGARVKDLNRLLVAEGVNLKIYMGAEYYLDRSVPELTRMHYPLATMADSYYVLIEMPVSSIPPYMDYTILGSASDSQELERLIPFLRPVIAHPERNESVMKEFSRLDALRNRGYFFQVNMETVLGASGRHPLKLAKKMAGRGMIDLIGTDAHSPEKLKDMLPGFRRRVEKLLGDKQAARVLDDNPTRVIRNQLIEWED